MFGGCPEVWFFSVRVSFGHLYTQLAKPMVPSLGSASYGHGLLQATLHNRDSEFLSGLGKIQIIHDMSRCRNQQAHTAKRVNFQKYRRNSGPLTTHNFIRTSTPPPPHFPSIYLSFVHLLLGVWRVWSNGVGAHYISWKGALNSWDRWSWLQ